MKLQRMNNKGFTLIETTVAILVMMVVGLGASSLFLYAVRYNSGASQRSIAMAVAQQRLETLRGADYNDAGLAFGVHAPETVVLAPGTTSTYAQGSAQTYAAAPASASSNSSGQVSGYAAGGVNQAAAPPAPTPTPISGGVTSTPSGSTTYQIQKQVVPFPLGTPIATATQKQITIRIVPINGNGDAAWANLNPIEVVFRRSLGAPGPYKE